MIRRASLLAKGALALAGASLLAPAAVAEQPSQEVSVSLFMRMSHIDSLRGDRDWAGIDAKRVLGSINLDKKIDDKEKALLLLLLADGPFTVTTVRAGQTEFRSVEGNLSPRAEKLFADALGIEVDQSAAFFGAEQAQSALLIYRDQRVEWPRGNDTSDNAYADVSAMSYAFTGLRDLTDRYGIYPSTQSDRYVFDADAPALEGDFVTIMYMLSLKLQKIQFEVAPECTLAGQTLSEASKRVLTHEAINTCLTEDFGNDGESYGAEPMTRGHMLRQIMNAVREWMR